jgi:hypothetical protein
MLSRLTYNSYSQNADVKGLLNKPETRTEIFNTILNDHELMMDFMKAMKGNDHAMMTMQNESHEMGEMKAKTGTVEMKGNPQMMGNGHMMEMMKENPEMMQKMNEKGMIKMDSMPMMQNPGDEKELLHKH